jgi:hypothetical protein
MSDESNLHSLISRQSEERSLPFAKLLRLSLLAATERKFAVRAASGQLSTNWRQRLREMAAVAEAQYDWGWKHKRIT